MKLVTSSSKLVEGQRVAVVEKKAFGSSVRIGYVFSFSQDRELLYVDYRWRERRKYNLWTDNLSNSENQVWDLVLIIEGQIEVYPTDRSLKHVKAVMRKRHPDWKWSRK